MVPSDELGELLLADRLVARSDTAAAVLRAVIRYSTALEVDVELLVRPQVRPEGIDWRGLFADDPHGPKLGFGQTDGEPVLGSVIASRFDLPVSFRFKSGSGADHRYRLAYEVEALDAAARISMWLSWPEHSIGISHTALPAGKGTTTTLWGPTD